MLGHILRSDEQTPAFLSFKGEGGVPRVQIMKNELECLGDRKGHDNHLAKKFLKPDF